MNNKVYEKSGLTVSSPVIIKDALNRIWVISAFSGEPPQFENGYISAKCISEEKSEIIVTKESGIYGSVSASADDNGAIWIAFTHRVGELTRICLVDFHDGSTGEMIDISNGFGRNELPYIAIVDNKIWIAWNSYIGKTSMIFAASAAIDGTSCIVNNIAHVKSDAQCYRPKLISDINKTLYLFYEAFFDNRYHIIGRIFDPDASDFISPVDIGFTDGNDLGASVCLSGGYPIVVWENSKPLHKGYVYPPFPDITIPAFGHGWRVNTKIGGRSISYNDGKWTIASLTDRDDQLVYSDEAGFAGAPSVTADFLGNPIISYAAFTLGKGINIRASVLVNGNLIDVEVPDIFVPQRIHPNILFDGGILYISQLSKSGGEFGIAVYSVKLPKADVAPRFKTVSVKQIMDNEENRMSSRGYAIDYRGKCLKAFRGDLHMHSNVSHCSLHEGFHSTELEEKYRFSRDVGNLDFAMVTDHDSMTDFEWKRTLRESEFHNRPDDFIAFPGFEWTSSMQRDHENFGHRNVLFLNDDAPLLRIRDPKSDTPENLWRNLDPNTSMTIPHHPSCGEHLFNWDHFNPEFDRLAEIFQVRGSDEYADCPLYPPTFGRSAIRGHSLIDALNRGYKIGFTSGGEHEGVGVTYVFAENLTCQSIFDALKARHTYGTTGARINIDFRVNGFIMGDELPIVEKPSIHIAISADSEIANVRIMRDGVSLMNMNDFGNDVEIDIADQSMTGDMLKKSHYYYAAITLSDGEMAWTSPVFLNT